ncbi:MAG: hypothetical protein GXP46_12560 [Deferribacteres bacterium]|nr:hypothetical protein [Deferribacteres bacterium]
MSSTLNEAIKSLKKIQKSSKSRRKVSNELLGKYAGIIPDGKTSTEFVRELRSTSYGKVK